MSELDRQENLHLSVSNFGPIASAEIDLRPLTVFIGPSNTGKSYLAILVYALHKFFGSSPFGFGSYRFPGIVSGLLRERQLQPLLNNLYISPDTLQELRNWIRRINSEVRSSSHPNELHAPLPDSVASLVRPLLRGVSALTEVAVEEIARSFGFEDSIRLLSQGSNREVHIAVGKPLQGVTNDNELCQYELKIGRESNEFRFLIPDELPLQIQGSRDFTLFERQLSFLMSSVDQEQERARIVLSTLCELIVPQTVGSLSRRAYYLPADRTGVMHAHRVVVSSLIGRAPRAGLGPQSPVPVLSGVLADFLEVLIGLGDLQHSRPQTKGNLADQLEKEMLSGVIRNKDSITGYPEFSYQPNGWQEDLPLMNTSSMVSELAPVVLYLRYVVESGELLIIEEPESHLHPAMQVEFIRQLADVVNAGVRVMLTTHSEWVLEELANLVRLNDLGGQKRTEALKDKPALDRADVGVWLFEKNEGQNGSSDSSIVKELPLDLEDGRFASGYDRVARETYNDWALISNLVEGEEKS